MSAAPTENSEPSPDQILIVGGTGRVGAATAAHLRATTTQVRLAGRQSEVRIDHDDPASYQGAFDGVRSALFATPDRPDSDAVHERLINAAVDAGVERVVMLSAASAGWTPPASFGIAHAAGERVLRDSGLDWVILRPTVFQETLAMFAADAHKGRLIVPTCRERVAFVAVDDVAAVAAAALQETSFNHRVLELTGPQSLSFGEVAEMAAVVVERTVTHRNLPHPIARRALPRVAGMSRWMADNVVDLFGGLAKGHQSAITTDIFDVLGRAPTPLARTLPAILGPG